MRRSRSRATVSHPDDLALALIDHANILVELGRLDEAEALFNEAAPLLPQLGASDIDPAGMFDQFVGRSGRLGVRVAPLSHQRAGRRTQPGPERHAPTAHRDRARAPRRRRGRDRARRHRRRDLRVHRRSAHRPSHDALRPALNDARERIGAAAQLAPLGAARLSPTAKACPVRHTWCTQPATPNRHETDVRSTRLVPVASTTQPAHGLELSNAYHAPSPRQRARVERVAVVENDSRTGSSIVAPRDDAADTDQQPRSPA